MLTLIAITFTVCYIVYTMGLVFTDVLNIPGIYNNMYDLYSGCFKAMQSKFNKNKI